jgi:hypothetical protein
MHSAIMPATTFQNKISPSDTSELMPMLEQLSIGSQRESYPRAHDVLWNVELIEQILLCTSPATFLCFGKTCKTARALVHDWTMRTFDINRHLSRFFADPRAFRALQARTGTLISGSNALQFLDRIVYEDADLDLYLSRGFELDVGRHLEREGYVFTSSKTLDESFADAVDASIDEDYEEEYWTGEDAPAHRVYTFLCPTTMSRPSRKIQLIVSEGTPIGSILGFHSSECIQNDEGTSSNVSLACVLNFISHENAYSLFPRITFENCVSLALPNGTDQSVPVDKYAQRGWKIIGANDVDNLLSRHDFPRRAVWFANTPLYAGQAVNACQKKITYTDMEDIVCFRMGSRWVDDSQSWVLKLHSITSTTFADNPLPTCGSPALSHLGFDPARLNNFALLFDVTRRCFQILAYRLEYMWLRHSYLVSDLEWCGTLAEKMRAFKAPPWKWAPTSGLQSLYVYISQTIM